MFEIIPRFIASAIIKILKLALALTANIHYVILTLSSVVEGLLQINQRSTNEDNISRPTYDMGSVYTQTEESLTQSTRSERKNNSNPDIFIYNLNASKKVTITHKDLDYIRSHPKLSHHYKNTKAETKRTTLRSCCNHRHSTTVDDKYQSNSSLHSSKSSPDSPNSSMSLERDVTNSEIIINTLDNTFTRSNYITKNSTSTDDGNFNHNQENRFDFITSESNYSEYSEKNDSGEVICIDDKLRTNSKQIKSYSSIDEELDDQWPNPHTCADTSSGNQIQNDTRGKENLKQFPNTSSEPQTFTGKKLHNRHRIMDRTLLLDRSVKKRLSLPSDFRNRANEAEIDFKKIQAEIIKNELKGTPRHNKSLKEIKYPLSPELGLTVKPEDVNESSKEMLSCSSYESLPISDHVRTAFERSNLFSLYKKSFLSVSVPDFSCVDNLVEAFQTFDGTLSVSEASLNEIPATSSTKSDIHNKSNKSLRGQGKKLKTERIDECSSSTEELIDKIIFDGISTEQIYQENTFNEKDTLLSSNKSSSHDLTKPNLKTILDEIMINYKNSELNRGKDFKKLDSEYEISYSKPLLKEFDHQENPSDTASECKKSKLNILSKDVLESSTNSSSISSKIYCENKEPKNHMDNEFNLTTMNNCYKAEVENFTMYETEKYQSIQSDKTTGLQFVDESHLIFGDSNFNSTLTADENTLIDVYSKVEDFASAVHSEKVFLQNENLICEEENSSGDTSSDNSVSTVKDLVVCKN